MSVVAKTVQSIQLSVCIPLKGFCYQIKNNNIDGISDQNNGVHHMPFIVFHILKLVF